MRIGSYSRGDLLLIRSLAALDFVQERIGWGEVLAASTPGYGCLAETLFKMAVGNQLGVLLDDGFAADEHQRIWYGQMT